MYFMTFSPEQTRVSKMKKVISGKAILSFLVGYFTCCTWAYPSRWPASSSSSSSYSLYPSPYAEASPNAYANYYPFAPSADDVDALAPAGLMDVFSQSPYSYGYNDGQGSQDSNQEWNRALPFETDGDYWADAPVQEQYQQLLPDYLYDDAEQQMTNSMPESESELEELKAEERRREAEGQGNWGIQHDFANIITDKASSVLKVPSSGTSMTSTPPPPPPPKANNADKRSASSSTVSPSINKVPFYKQPGQKEVPLLRPPVIKMKVTQDEEIHDHDDPVIAVAQRSAPATAEKPSAYDRLRQYISLEDALKKEAEKRRAPTNRLQKRRAPVGKKIIADTDSLSGQLNNLKNSM